MRAPSQPQWIRNMHQWHAIHERFAIAAGAAQSIKMTQQTICKSTVIKFVVQLRLVGQPPNLLIIYNEMVNTNVGLKFETENIDKDLYGTMRKMEKPVLAEIEIDLRDLINTIGVAVEHGLAVGRNIAISGARAVQKQIALTQSNAKNGHQTNVGTESRSRRRINKCQMHCNTAMYALVGAVAAFIANARLETDKMVATAVGRTTVLETKTNVMTKTLGVLHPLNMDQHAVACWLNIRNTQIIDGLNDMQFVLVRLQCAHVLVCAHCVAFGFAWRMFWHRRSPCPMVMVAICDDVAHAVAKSCFYNVHRVPILVLLHQTHFLPPRHSNIMFICHGAC